MSKEYIRDTSGCKHSECSVWQMGLLQSNNPGQRLRPSMLQISEEKHSCGQFSAGQGVPMEIWMPIWMGDGDLLV